MIIARMPNGRRALLADAGAAAPATATDTAGRFKAIGYRQTKLAAADGGTMINSHGWRFAAAALPAIAASFVGQPFITGHDWGDTRARGGTIAGAEVQDLGDEVAIVFDVEATAAWALEGLANGTIDRFSIGAAVEGEIYCTIHRTPVFASCWCCPGEVVTVERDDQELELVAEWEHEGARGVELSAVNVPAVERTGLVNARAQGDRRRELLVELSELCGRQHPELVAVAPAPAPAPAAATPAPIASTLTADVALALGLAADATEMQIRERAVALRAEQQRTQADLDAAHVEHAIETLQRTHDVSVEVLARLRATAKLQGRCAFDAMLDVVKLAAAERAPGPGHTPSMLAALQSSSPPAANPGTPLADGDGPDAYEANRTNAELPRFMRMARITADDVRKHGARQFRTLPNLAELAELTAKRGD